MLRPSPSHGTQRLPNDDDDDDDDDEIASSRFSKLLTVNCSPIRVKDEGGTQKHVACAILSLATCCFAFTNRKTRRT